MLVLPSDGRSENRGADELTLEPDDFDKRPECFSTQPEPGLPNPLWLSFKALWVCD